MSEIKQLKRFIYSATVTSGSGSQSFYIDAESREEADKRAANQESNGMYADDSEVTDLDALEYEDETTVDDFGDFPLISREQSLIAQLEAAQKLNPLSVNVSELEATYIGDIRLHMAAISNWKLRAETAEAELSSANEKLSKPVVLLDKYVLNEKGQYILDGKCEPRIGFALGWNAAIKKAGFTVEGNADAE